MRLRPFICTKIERLSSLRKPPCKVRFFVKNRSRKYRPKVTVTTLFPTVSHPAFQLLAQTAHVCFHSRKRVHTRLRQQDRTQRHTQRNRGHFGWGWYHLPSDCFTRFGNSAWPGFRTANLAAFEPWPEVLSKNAESLRDSDALMRVAVPQASRPRWAALLCLQFGDVAVFSLCAQGFPHMQKRGWYHYPRSVLHILETPDGRLSKRLICHFPRSGGYH